jgi:CO dehydrogenase/acetyl-CoA synthase beta subunit
VYLGDDDQEGVERVPPLGVGEDVAAGEAALRVEELVDVGQNHRHEQDHRHDEEEETKEEEERAQAAIEPAASWR